jgi:hypothetical protein
VGEWERGRVGAWGSWVLRSFQPAGRLALPTTVGVEWQTSPVPGGKTPNSNLLSTPLPVKAAQAGADLDTFDVV